MLPPKKVQKRGTLVLADEFNGGQLNTAEWDYIISMYGGYVSTDR